MIGHRIHSVLINLVRPPVVRRMTPKGGWEVTEGGWNVAPLGVSNGRQSVVRRRNGWTPHVLGYRLRHSQVGLFVT